MKSGCQLAVDLYNLSAVVQFPLEIAPFPQMVQVAQISWPVQMALVNVTLSTTLREADFCGVFLAMNTARQLSLSNGVRLIASHIAHPAALNLPETSDTFCDFENYAVLVPANMPVSLYVSYANFSVEITANANLQVKEVA